MARLTDNLRRLAKILGDDLKKESANDDQRIMATYVRSKARSIADCARQVFDPNSNDSLISHQQGKGLTEQMRQDKIDRPLSVRRHHFGDSQESDSSDEAMQESGLIDLEEISEALVIGGTLPDR